MTTILVGNTCHILTWLSAGGCSFPFDQQCNWIGRTLLIKGLPCSEEAQRFLFDSGFQKAELLPEDPTFTHATVIRSCCETTFMLFCLTVNFTAMKQIMHLNAMKLESLRMLATLSSKHGTDPICLLFRFSNVSIHDTGSCLPWC